MSPPEPSLQETQQWMKERILPGDGAAGEGILREPGARRLSVYSGGYLARIQEALEESYPALRHVVGARSFSRIAVTYAAQHHSRDYNLSLSGRRFPEFLETHPLTQELPFLPDLALLEWKVTEAFHAFDRPPIEPARLAAVPPEEWDRLRLVFQPSVRLLSSAWPVLDIWEARDQPVQEVKINLVDRPQRILIFRSGFEVRCELLDDLQEKAIAELLAGKALGLLCEERAASAADGDLPMAAWFSRWGSAGLIAGLETVS